MTVIDVHSHFRSQRFLEAGEEAGALRELPSWAHYGAKSLESVRKTRPDPREVAEKRVLDMDEGGVDHAVLSVGSTHSDLRDEAAAERLARIINDDFTELSEFSMGRLRGFASLPLPHIARSLAEIERQSKNSAMVGFDIGPSISGLPLDDERFDIIWSRLNDVSATVFVHPGSTPTVITGANEFSLASIIVGPAELATAIIRLVVKGIHQRFPAVNFIFAVAGGMAPAYADRFDRWFASTKPELFNETGGVAASIRNFWFDTSLNGHQDLLASACRVCGPERLVLGSDHPKDSSKFAVDFVNSSPHLSDDAKHKILTNASSFIQL